MMMSSVNNQEMHGRDSPEGGHLSSGDFWLAYCGPEEGANGAVYGFVHPRDVCISISLQSGHLIIPDAGEKIPTHDPAADPGHVAGGCDRMRLGSC